VAPLPDDAALHRAVIAYISDMTLLGTSMLPHGISGKAGTAKGASLDHALWFHEDARADQWLLYACDSPGPGRCALSAGAASSLRTGGWWPKPRRKG
jgi:acyl-CoA thioesterase-2